MDPTNIEIVAPAPVEAPPPAPPPPDPWRAWGEIMLCSGYPTQFVLGVLLQVSGLSPFRPDGSLSGPFVFLLSLFDTAVLLAIILCMCLGYKSMGNVFRQLRQAFCSVRL